VYMYQNSLDSWISVPFWTLTLDPCPSGEPLCTGNVKPRPQDTQIKSKPQASHLQTQTTGHTLHTYEIKPRNYGHYCFLPSSPISGWNASSFYRVTPSFLLQDSLKAHWYPQSQNKFTFSSVRKQQCPRQGLRSRNHSDVLIEKVFINVL